VAGIIDLSGNPVTKLTTNDENDLKNMVLELKPSMLTLRIQMHPISIELKQELSTMSPQIKRQDDTINKIV
jgi:hypothetical protein